MINPSKSEVGCVRKSYLNDSIAYVPHKTKDGTKQQQELTGLKIFKFI